MNMNMGNPMANTPAELGPKPWTLDYTPNADMPIGTLPGKDRVYPDKAWDAALVGIRAAFEYAKNIDWDAMKAALDAAPLPADSPGAPAPFVVGWQNDEPFIQRELNYLLGLMQDDRDRYMGEILAQADGAPFYWFGLLDIQKGQKPKTVALIQCALRIGEMVGLHFKEKYHRIRPSVLCAGLLPPFGPPLHPAFPSGHATQGHLISSLLLEIADGANMPLAPYASELKWLAARVAKNRERAGLHYPSDSLAGAFLADFVTADLKAGLSPTIVTPLLKAAAEEWS